MEDSYRNCGTIQQVRRRLTGVAATFTSDSVSNHRNKTMGQFTATAEFNCPPSALRDLLGDPCKFEASTDPDAEFELIAAPRRATVGEELAFSIVTGGFRQVLRHRWVVVDDLEITVEQVDGPTQSWRHAQVITETPTGCTLTETMTFEPPPGMLGFVVTEAAIMKSLEAGTAVRHQLLGEQLVASQPA